MSESLFLPTKKDEAWRYSDTDALAGMDVGRIDDWRDIDVAEGETWRDCIVIADHDGTADHDVSGTVSGNATELRRLRITVRRNATCALFAVIAAARLGRIEIVVMLEEGAHFEFGGVTLGGRDTTREFVTRVAHEHPGATSNQVIRSVHWGHGTGNFLGRIDVARAAQKTDAGQDFKGLLLEKGASVNCVPQLEIYADDVKCAHGATVGQLDEQARYYMAARGIPPELSRKLLVRAFLGDAFVALDDADETERLMGIALAKLDRHL